MKRKTVIHYAVNDKILYAFDDFVSRLIALAGHKGYSRLIALKTVGTYDPDWSFASRGISKTERGKQVTSTPKLVHDIVRQLRSITPKQVFEEDSDVNVEKYWKSETCVKFRHILADNFETDMRFKLGPENTALSDESDGQAPRTAEIKLEDPTAAHYLSDTQMVGCTFEDLFSLGVSTQDISKKMQAISDQYPFPVQYESEWGSNENWEGIYKRVPHYGYFIFRADELIGYFLFVFLDDATFARGVKGENINETMSIADIETPTIPGEYKMYFVDAFVHPDHFSGATFRVLANRFYEILKYLSDRKHEIYVSNIMANISTHYARKLVERCGFLKACDHKVHKKFDKNMIQSPTEIFTLDMSRHSAKLFGKSEHITKETAQRYAARFSIPI
jgi:hypothetical protein